ncbi:MAG TPA: hypothetical protein VK501_23380 [Baekduia sp.]|uniref:hypothetical protein n=1 Tax=Baekduia sp. TaxID=2600305 RepID=UPI002BE72161|nr:hypothetical protein [Baekduia sp.]HMJ36867.1 hypothetical protein [Baekduia sp.]
MAASTTLSPRVRAATSREAVVVGGLVVWSLALLLLTWGRWGDLTMDTGYDLLAASRTAHGELPYADYVYFYGPVGPFLLGGIYAITGPALWPAVALGLAMAFATIALTYRLARVFVEPVPAALAAGLVASAALGSANNSYVLPHTTSGPLATALVLGAVLVLARWLRDGEQELRRPVIAGGLVGFVGVTRPEVALAVYVAIACWLAVRVWSAGAAGRGLALRQGAALLAPAIVLPLMVYGAFLTVVSPHDLLWENLYPRDFVRAGGDVVLKAHAPLTALSFAKLAGHAVAYAAGLAALVGAGVAIERGGRLRTVVLAGAGLAVVAFLAVLVAKPDTVRFYLKWPYAWIPAGAALAVLVLVWRRRRAEAASPAAEIALLLVLLMAGLTANTYAEFLPYPNARFPAATAYLLPLAAVLLVALHVRLAPRGRAGALLGVVWIGVLVVANAGLSVHDARQESQSVRGLHGTLGAHPAEASALRQALTVIARETRPGDPILLAPQMSALYVMSGRRDPLPQLSLLPGALATAADEDRAIAQMDQLRLAITDRKPLDVYDQGAFGTSYDQRIAAWLKRKFRHAATLRGDGPDGRSLDIWIRRSP